MNCKHCQSEIEHLEFEQSFAMNADVLRHIESCVSCREFKNERESLRLLIGGLERVTTPSNFDARLRARLEYSKTHKPNAVAWLNFSLLRPSLTFGFVLMLLAVGFVVARPFLTNENRSLNSIAGLSSVNLGELSSENLTAFPTSMEIKEPSIPDNETIAKDGKANPIHRNNFVNNNPREQIMVEDKSFNLAVDENISRITIDARSQYVIVNDKKVPLRSVSFGSPTLIDVRTVKTNHVSYSDNVW